MVSTALQVTPAFSSNPSTRTIIDNILGRFIQARCVGWEIKPNDNGWIAWPRNHRSPLGILTLKKYAQGSNEIRKQYYSAARKLPQIDPNNGLLYLNIMLRQFPPTEDQLSTSMKELSMDQIVFFSSTIVASGMMLYDLDLSGLDLSNMALDLRDSTLYGSSSFNSTIMSNSKLQGLKIAEGTCDFGCADLSNTDATGIVVPQTDWRGAILRGVCLDKAILTGADLRGIEMNDQTSLIGADLTHANLRGLDLTIPQIFSIEGTGVSPLLTRAMLWGAIVPNSLELTPLQRLMLSLGIIHRK